MWDAFLDRTCHSCIGLRDCPPFCKRKTDLYSFEYSSYIRRDIITCFGYHMKDSKQTPRKGTPRSTPSYYDKYKNEQKTKKKQIPVYFRSEPETLKEKRPKYPPHCSMGEKCACEKKYGKNVGKPEKNLAVIQVVEDAKGKEPPIRFKPETVQQKSGEVVKDEKICKERFVGDMKNKMLAFGLFKSKSKKHEDKSKKDRKSEKKPAPEPPPPVVKLRPKKKKTYDKKGIVLETRTASMPMYKTLLSGLNLDRWKIYHYGEKGSGTQAKTDQSQDFYNLREECLQNGTLFEDREFPATDSSLFFSQRPDRHYEWKRPHEIIDNPQFFVEGFSRFDVQQGELGDCWLLAAAANLTLYRRLFFQIVPDDQGFDDKYAGIFHFRFWQYGRWIDVVIDDRLPTYRGQLIFLHSTEENEFWSALLEKAYAKIHGSYEALKGGSTCEAMEDFTGGVTEMYEMDSSPPNLFQIIVKAYERSSLMGCSIEPDPNVLEAQTPEGLIKGHAYSITRVQYVDIQTPNVTGKIPLVRLRNPWGNESEWNGPWSDGAPEWRFISESEKEELGLTFDNDGEFWMSYKDFQTHFSRLEICNLNPDSLTEEELIEGNKKRWEMSVFEGEWVRGVTAGGCRNFLDSFWHNPQYRITLTEVDDGDEEGGCTMIVALMQKNRRQIRSAGADLLTVGFAIYHLPYPDRVPKPLDLKFFKYNASVARSPSFINLREVSCRFKLPPGTYCIVPSTFDPNEEGEFLLRVFTEHANIMEENDDNIGYGDMDAKSRVEIVIPQKVAQPPTDEEVQETDKAYATFLKIAGKDEEVDWMELKQVLDKSMKAELEPEQNEESTPNCKTAISLNAAPPTTEIPPQTQTNDGNGFVPALLNLICGTFCKDTPLAEIIPAPTQNVPLCTTFSELHMKRFSKDVCRSMVAMLDADRSGKLNFKEFQKLWTSLRNWKNAWLLHDIDNSGTFSGFELRDALNAAGYRLNNRILNVLMHRYGNRNGEINFDDFMMCAIKLKTMIDIFKQKDETDTNTASFSLEEWLECTLYS